MRQKILPELFSLHTRGVLPKNFQIVGVSRRDWSDYDVQTYVRNVLVQKNVSSDIDGYVARFTFIQGDVYEPAVFEKLATAIGEHEALLYFALSPELYKGAFAYLVASSLAQKAKQLRLIIEKPFGTSGTEAELLNNTLHTTFTEEQLYRVDHYLGKDSLTNIPPIETNGLQKIVVSFLQKEGVEMRPQFYEATGALLDVGQNHMMEMFALTLDANNRAAVVADLHALTAQEVASHTTRSQWSGYRAINGVAADSAVETYFKIETSWRGIPTTFEGGKYMQEEKKEITFQYTDHTRTITIENNKGEHEHERLILACLRGEHERFMSKEEIAVQWRFIDAIACTWRSGTPPLSTY